MNKQYDYKSLIDAKIMDLRWSGLHEDVEKYYTGLVNTLESLLDMQLNPPADSPIWENMPRSAYRTLPELFTDVIVYLTVPITGSIWIEGGPGVTLWHAKDMSEKGNVTNATYRKLSAQYHELHETCKQLLYELFKLWYGDKTNKVVTSEDLLKAGFDDSNEPDVYAHLLS